MAYTKEQLTNIIQTIANQVGKSFDTGSSSNNARAYLAAALGEYSPNLGRSLSGIPQWLYDEINRYAEVTNPPYKVFTSDGKPLVFTPWEELSAPVVFATRSDVENFFKSKGFIAKDILIDKFANRPLTEAQELVNNYVKDNQITKQEAIKIYNELGYEPSETLLYKVLGDGTEASLKDRVSSPLSSVFSNKLNRLIYNYTNDSLNRKTSNVTLQDISEAAAQARLYGFDDNYIQDQTLSSRKLAAQNYFNTKILEKVYDYTYDTIKRKTPQNSLSDIQNLIGEVAAYGVDLDYLNSQSQATQERAATKAQERPRGFLRNLVLDLAETIGSIPFLPEIALVLGYPHVYAVTKATQAVVQGETNPFKVALDVGLNVAIANGSAKDIGKAIGPSLGATTAVSQAAVGEAVLAATKAGLQGGDLEQVVQAALFAAATPVIANKAGGITNEIARAVESVAGADAAKIAANAISYGSAAGIKSLIMGDNPLTPEDEGDALSAFLKGATTAGLSTGIGQLGETYLKDVPAPLRAAIISGATAKAVGGDAEAAFKNTLISALGQEAMKQANAQELINKAYNDSSRALDLLPEADKAFVNQLAEQDIAYAQEIYGADSGQRLTDAQLREAFSQGKPFDYIDNLYTTEAEAKDIWKATVGTEPTEAELRSLIGLDTGQVTKQTQDIAYDRSNVSSEELDEFLRDIGKGQITLTPEEQMDLLGGSEVAARNAIAGKYNAFVEDKNTTLGSEAEEFWKKAGLDPASMTMDDLAMMLKGNEASAETYAQRLADVRETTFKPVDDFAKQAAVEYAAMKAGYNTYEYGGKTYTVSKDDIAASADGRVLSEYTRIVDGALKVSGVDPNTLTEQQRQDLMTAAYRQYGNDINQLRAASAQDFINGNLQTLESITQGPSLPTQTIIVRGGNLAWADAPERVRNAASPYLPDGLVFATDKQIDDNDATKITLPNGMRAWVVNKPTSEVDLSDITLGSLQGQDPWATDPEAALLTYSQFDTKQLGGAKELVINSAKAAVDLIQNIEAGTGGFVSITPEGKSTLIDVVATTAKAGGNVVKNFSDLIWATGLVERDNVAGATANALIRYSDSILSKDAKTQQDNILKAINSADTLKGKYDALMTASKANPWGAALIAGGEIIEELPTLLAGGAVGKVAAGIYGKAVGFAAARGSDAALSAGESAGVGYAETYDNIIKAGGSAQYAASQAAKSAFQAAAITFGSDLVGDAALVKKFMGDLKDLSVGQLTKVGAKQFVTEGFEEGLQNISTQYNSFGTVDMNQAMNAFTIGSVLGVTTTAGILGPGAINYNAQVALGLNGEGVTLQQVLDGTVQVAPGSFDINAVPITIGDTSVSLGDFTKVVDTSLSDPNFSLTSYKTNLEGLAQIDYGGSGLSDIALAVTLAPDANTLTTQLQNMGLSIQQQADIGNTKFNNAFASSDEIRAAFESKGYKPTAEEIAKFTGPNHAGLTYAIPAHINANTTTLQEAKDAAARQGVTLTDEQAAQYVGQGYQAETQARIEQDVDPLAVTRDEAIAALQAQGFTPEQAATLASTFVGQNAESELAGKVSEFAAPRQVTFEEAKAELQRLGYNPTDEEVNQYVRQGTDAIQEGVFSEIGAYVDPRVVTEDEVRAFLKDQGIAEPTDADVQALIGQYAQGDLAGKVEAALPTIKFNALTQKIENMPSQEGVEKAISDAIAGIQFPEGLTTEDVTKAITDYMKDNPGLSATDVTNAVAEELKKLPAYAKPADVTTAIETAVGKPATEDEAATGLYADLAGVEEKVTSLADILGAPATEDVEATGVFKLIAENEAAGLARDEAIQKAISDYARDTGLDIDALNALVGTPATETSDATGIYAAISASETALSGKITGLEGVIGAPATTDAEATGIFKLISDNEAAGLARDEAIQKAVSDYARDTGLSIDALNELVGTPATEDAAATGFYAALAASESALSGQISGLEGVIGAPATEDTEATGVFKLIADNEAAGLARDEAIQKAISDYARDTGLSIDALSGLVGVPATDTSDATGIYGAIAASESALGKQITGVEEELSGQISGLEGVIGAPATEDAEATGVFKLIADNEAAGLSRDNAISKAIEDYARDTGVSIEALSGLVGTPATDTAEATGIYGALAASEAALSGQITGVGEQVTGLAGVLGTPATADTEATGVFKLIDDAEAAGIARDDAIRAIIGGPATEAGPSTGLYGELEGLGLDLGTIQQTLGAPATDTTPATGLYGALETGLTGVETRLGEDITGVETRVTQQIQDVATVLGKPAQAVTQADIDLVNQMIQGQVQTDLTYDANQDGVIDQNDIAFLTSITTGTEPPEFPAGTRWAPTGVYGQIAGLGADLTRQLEQQELARQAAAEEAERAAQGRFQQQQQQQRVQQFMGMLTQPGALQQKVQVKAPEVMKLEQLYGGLYDPSAGLFRTPQQEQFFASPYGNYFDGGEVTEDELLAIVRG